MKVAIIADIHDNAHNCVLALEEIQNQDVEKILFLGDFAGAAIANLLKSSPIMIYSIWGNNDGDKTAITKFALSEESNLEVGFGTYDVIEIDKRKLFLTHFPLIARSVAKSGDFDAVFYGHNHLKNKEKIQDCLLLNPGEIAAYKTGISSYAIYDTEKNDAVIYELEDSVTTNTTISKKKFEEIKFEWSQQKSHQS